MYNYTDNVKLLFDICQNTTKPINCAIWVTREHEFRAFRILRDLLKDTTTNLLRYTPNSIQFKNESKIDILCCREESRGRRYTFALYEEGVNKEFLHYIIYPMTASGFPPKKFRFEEGEIYENFNRC